MIYVIKNKNYIKVSNYYKEVTVTKSKDNYVVKPILKSEPILVKNTDNYTELTPQEVYNRENFDRPVKEKKIREDII